MRNYMKYWNTAGSWLLGNIKVGAIDEHASRHIIQSDPLLPKQINHNTKNVAKIDITYWQNVQNP